MKNIRKNLEIINREGLKQIWGGDKEPAASEICNRTEKPTDPGLTNCEEKWSDTYKKKDGKEVYCGKDSSWTCDEPVLAISAGSLSSLAGINFSSAMSVGVSSSAFQVVSVANFSL